MCVFSRTIFPYRPALRGTRSTNKNKYLRPGVTRRGKYRDFVRVCLLAVRSRYYFSRFVFTIVLPSTRSPGRFGRFTSCPVRNAPRANTIQRACFHYFPPPPVVFPENTDAGSPGEINTWPVIVQLTFDKCNGVNGVRARGN